MSTSTSTEASALAIDDRTAGLLFRDAHTAYAFTDQPVTDEQLAAIYDLVRHAPTAMNSQPLRITYIRSEAAKARLLPLLAEGNRPKSASAPVVAILAADTNFHENFARVLPQLPGAKEKFADDDARAQAARFNASLQAGYFIIAARAAPGGSRRSSSIMLMPSPPGATATSTRGMPCRSRPRCGRGSRRRARD